MSFVLFHMCVLFVVVDDVFRGGGGGCCCVFVFFCFEAVCVCFHAGKIEDLNRKLANLAFPARATCISCKDR